MTFDDNPDLEDDSSHSIPRIEVFDTVVTFDGGGAYIGIVIATPMDASQRSLHRLIAKQHFYLESFFSAHGREKWGTPKQGKMRIYVNVHPDSSEAVFEMLNAFQRRAKERGVEVRISPTVGKVVRDH